MKYEVYGPFWINQDSGTPWKSRKKEFWENVSAVYTDLPSAVGIYVFSTCYGNKFTPWYVGKTNAQTGFKGEVFQEHKLNHYVATARKGRRCIHLIAKVTPTLSFCRPSASSEREIDQLETMMIGMALQANKGVRNARKTWFLRNCHVPGLIGAPVKGRPSGAVDTLRLAFGLR